VQNTLEVVFSQVLSVEINESRIPVVKGKGIPGDEKREREKTRFKTEANSALTNENSREKSSTSSWEIEKETMLQKRDSAGYNAEQGRAKNFVFGEIIP